MTVSGEGGPRPCDLLIRHAWLITMDDQGSVFPDGAVAVGGNRILAVGEDADIAKAYAAPRTIDVEGAPVHPGFVECHLHASFQIFRGALPDQLVESDAFIWDQPQGFAQGMLESPAAGCSACEVQARVRTEILRAPRSRAEALERMGGELARNADPDALVSGHVAILGLGTASEELMMEAKAVADRAGVTLNLHQSYSPADTEADRRRFGKDPLVHLAETGFLARNVTFGHANHMTDAECEVLIDRGTSIAWAPAASMMWGHGGAFHGRHAELWRRGANIALGSDSANWSNDFDLWRQANLAVMAAREAHGDRRYLIAEDGIAMATRAGARAAGLEEQIGSLEPGKRADLVVHTLDRPEMVPTTDMVRNLFYASRSKSVHTVVIDGRIVLEEGRFVALDERRLLAEVRRASAGLFRRMGVSAEQNELTPRPAAR